MTEASKTLRALARRLAEEHCELPGARAALLTGSAAQGISDFHSDIDLILYYDALPGSFPLVEAYPPIWRVGDPSSGAVMMAHKIEGVECQLVHSTLDSLDAQFRAVQKDLDIASPTSKALAGILDGLPLFGEELIATLKSRAADFPDALATKMIEAHLNFFPLWNAAGWLQARDCALWQAEIRYEACKNILAILCGLNRVYFTPFQLKHTKKLCEKLLIAPENLHARLESALSGDLSALKTLFEETVALIETHRPEISTEAVRQQLSRTWTPWELRDRGLDKPTAR